MTINRHDGKFQACYWRDAGRIESEPDDAEYSDFAMELKQRIHRLFREGRFQYAAIFFWNETAGTWELVEECEPRR
jgi:hypothetical protein